MPRAGLDTERVLDAAIALADEGGLQQATFARLAEVLEVRAPSLYNHVHGRQELLRLIRLRGLRALGEAIATSAAGLAGPEAVRATARAYRAYALANPGCYEATIAASTVPDAEIEDASERLLALLGAILQGWHLQGEEAVDAIRAIRSALHGFVVLERAGGFAMARERDLSFEALVEMLIAGLDALASAEGSAPPSARRARRGGALAGPPG